MIRSKILIILGILLILFSCNEIDNYDAPNGDIYGKLTDKTTGEQLQSEQPNGFTIKLFEKGGAINSPISFQGKPDGTFENAMIFQNEYKVLATEGAFFYIDTVEVQVGTRTEVNFEVTPFLAVINVSVTPSAGKITANYKIARSQVGDKITERKTLVSKIPTVNNVTFSSKKETNITGLSDTDILNTQFADDVTGLTAGNYYVRIAVRTNNALKKYNYSKIFTVTIP